MRKIKILDIVFNLFEGEGAAAPSGDATAAMQGTGGNPNAESASAEGKNDSDAGNQTPEERRKAYDAFIKANKDLYAEDTQRIINRRFKDSKAKDEKLERQQRTLDKLYMRYGVESGDYDGLDKAIEGDRSYIENAADDANMDVDQYERMLQAEYENRQLRAAQDAWQGRQAMDAQMAAWNKEASELQTRYPNFDLRECANDPAFTALLKTGKPMEYAYKATHFDEFLAQASASAEKRITDDIRARGNRPAENGASSGSSVNITSDPSKWSDEDFAEIERRVRNGERISF